MRKFDEIVEHVASLSIEELEEIKRIIEEKVIERRREDILKSGEAAKKEFKEGKLKSYDNTNDLMNSLNEPD